MNISAVQGIPGHASSQRGFNLVELLVAMTIGLFLIAGVGYVFVGSKQSFNQIEAMGAMQENARYAFEYMAKDIRMAGFNGAILSGKQFNTAVTNGDDFRYIADLFDNDNTNASGTPLNYGPLKGYESITLTDIKSGTTATVRGSSDILAVVRADTEQAFPLESNPGPTIYSIACPRDGLAKPSEGELFVVADHSWSEVVQLGSNTDNDDSCSTTMDVDVSDLDWPSDFSSNWKDRILYRLRGAMYFINDSDDSGEPSLSRLELSHSSGSPSIDVQPLLAGVDDMQIIYGEDNDDSGGVGRYVDATGVGDWSRVRSVRITLTMISQSGKRVTTAGDGRLRTEFTTTIAVRNRLQ